MKNPIQNKVVSRMGKTLIAAAAVFTLLAVPAWAADAAPTSITLTSAIEKVLANSSEVITATNDFEKSKIQLQQAEKRSKDMDKAMGRPDEGQMTQDVYQVIVYGPKAAKIGMDMAEQGFNAQVAGSKVNTISLYYKIASCGKAENAALDAWNKAQANYKIINSKFKVGMESKLSVLSAQLQLDTAKTSLEAAQAETAQNKRNLCAQMGMDINTKFTLGQGLTYTKLNVGDIDKAVTDLVAKSPTVAVDKLSYDMAELDYNLTIGYIASFTYNGQIAKKTFDSAKAKYESTKRSTEAAARKQIESLQMAEKQYNMAVSGKEISAELYRLAVLRYDNGLSTQKDVLDAASELSAADTQVINALLNFNVAKTMLEQGLISQ